MTKTRVLIADDHALVREGIKLLINSQVDMEIIGEAGNGEAAWRDARALLPDVVVMDVSMPDLNGAQATERLKAVCPDIRVLALSAYEDEAHVRQLLASGASGYVLKRAIAEELTTAIRTVLKGGMHLDSNIAGKIVDDYLHPNKNRERTEPISDREREILVLIAWGYSNKEIAGQLHLSVKTIEGHKTRIFGKMNFQNRADAVRYALERGWLEQ